MSLISGKGFRTYYYKGGGIHQNLKYGTLLAKAYVQVPLKVELGMRGHLNKQEALAVLHEMVDLLEESVLISGVSLDYCASDVSKDPNKVGFYIIRMKCDLDNYTAKCLNPLLSKHNLSLREEKGYLVIVPC